METAIITYRRIKNFKFQIQDKNLKKPTLVLLWGCRIIDKILKLNFYTLRKVSNFCREWNNIILR